MANIETVVFDYYETLARLPDTIREPLFDDIAQRVGAELAPGEAYRHWRQRIASDLAVRLGGKRPPLDGPTPAFLTFRETWLERFRQLFDLWGVDAPGELGADAYRDAHAAAGLYSDAAGVLERLHDRMRVAVLSDADRDFLDACIRRNGLAMDAVVMSEDMRAYKPHVSLFREVCARLGAEPSAAVYVGDSPWADIEGARRAGMQAVWINRHEHVWPDDLEPPDARITALTELPELLA